LTVLSMRLAVDPGYSDHQEHAMNYDVIGDIHVHADALETLLVQLG
jgi:hypothetical protein